MGGDAMTSDVERWRSRWEPFANLAAEAAEAAGGGEATGVEDDPFEGRRDEPYDLRPVSGDVYVKCAECGKTSSWQYKAEPPAEGWGDLLPSQVRRTGRSDNCRHMREITL